MTPPVNSDNHMHEPSISPPRQDVKWTMTPPVDSMCELPPPLRLDAGWEVPPSEPTDQYSPIVFDDDAGDYADEKIDTVVLGRRRRDPTDVRPDATTEEDEDEYTPAEYMPVPEDPDKLRRGEFDLTTWNVFATTREVRMDHPLLHALCTYQHVTQQILNPFSTAAHTDLEMWHSRVAKSLRWMRQVVEDKNWYNDAVPPAVHTKLVAGLSDVLVRLSLQPASREALLSLEPDQEQPEDAAEVALQCLQKALALLELVDSDDGGLYHAEHPEEKREPAIFNSGFTGHGMMLPGDPLTVSSSEYTTTTTATEDETSESSLGMLSPAGVQLLSTVSASAPGGAAFHVADMDDVEDGTNTPQK
jgi:hypothetical protein